MLIRSKFVEIKARGRLPTPPGVVMRVIDLTRKDDVTNQEVAHAIKSDPALSGLVIKVANARVAYQTRPIASIVDAVSVLGFSTIRQLVLGLSLIESNRTGACPGFDYEDFWARSLLTAITAQNLLLESGIGSPEEIFTLGLIGQIGSLALATAYPQEYARILSDAAVHEEAELAKLELAEFEFDHNELTQAMLADWGMPQVFQEIVLHHEDPSLTNLVEGSRGWHLLNELHIANYFAKLCLAPEQYRRKMVPKLILIATRRGVELKALAGIADKSVVQWHEWSKLCGIRTTEVPLFAELFEAIPLVPSMLDVVDELPNGAGTGTFYKMRILLVDDDRATLLLIKSMLEKAGHTVSTAINGIEALSMVAKHIPQLIITDWLMPEMGGIEFCKTLRLNSAWRNIYVFIMTAQDGTEKLVEAFEAGANDYMTKPISPKALIARLRAGQRVLQLQEEMEFDRQELHKFADELAAFNHRLRKSDVSMRAILNNSPYMAWLKDTEGRYMQVNKTYVDYLQPKDMQENLQEIVGKTDFDLWSKERAEKYRAVEVEVMTTRQPKRIEESFQVEDKISWLETIKTPVIDENGRVLGTTGFARDITEQVNREEQRLAEVRVQRDALVREVNHRIKNNLQGVMGLLQQHGSHHPELDEALKVIVGRISSIAIIHGLQAQGVSEDVDLHSLITSIVEASGIQSAYKNELTLDVFLSRAESVPIALVLNELYTNACKHRIEKSVPVIKLKMSGADILVTIANRFETDLKTAAGNGQGLNLIKLLLPQKTTSLAVTREAGIYTAELRLSPPVIITQERH
jgi:PAS domain S-box-containing protein